MAPADAPEVAVSVFVGLGPREVRGENLHVPAGSSVRQVLDQAQVWAWNATLNLDALTDGVWTLAIWGRRVGIDHVVREGDRLELLRQLKVDPKEARRVRYRAHGEKLPKGIHRPKPKPASTR
jgi:putative ubiquitin-RnfH superfamily antitoxin RatB of RatAB toxin-antitoxin module